MSKEEVEEVLEWVRSTPVPTSTLLCNLDFLERANRKLHQQVLAAKGVAEFYANVPRAPFAKECDGGHVAQHFLKRLEKENGDRNSEEE